MAPVRTGTQEIRFPSDYSRCPRGGSSGSTSEDNGREMTAVSIVELGWTTICPLAYTDFRAIISFKRNTDFSDTDLLIDNMETISTILFHELLHILHDDFSKSSVPIHLFSSID